MVPRTGCAVFGSTGPWPLTKTQPSTSTAAEYAPVPFSFSGCLISRLIMAVRLPDRDLARSHQVTFTEPRRNPDMDWDCHSVPGEIEMWGAQPPITLVSGHGCNRCYIQLV